MTQNGIRDWSSVRTEVDLAKLPVTVDQSPSRAGAALTTGFGLLWCAITLTAADGEAGGGVERLAPLIGVGIALFGLATLYRRRRVTFHADRVEIEGRSLRGAESWSEPYSAFRGVLHRERKVRRKKRTTTYQIIELLHDDPRRSIPLYRTASTEIPRARWEGYARQLGLPALEPGAEGLQAREAEDLDKSLKDLAREGKVGHGYDPAGAVPEGLLLDRQDPERLRITVTASRYPPGFIALALAVSAILTVAAIGGGEGRIVLVIGALAFAAIPAFMALRDRRHPRVLELDRSRLRLTDSLFGDRPAAEVPLEEIETIAVAKIPGQRRQDLVISGDRVRLRFGAGLSKPALAWLKDFLTAAIATA